MVFDDGVRVNLTFVANFHALSDVGKGSDIAVFANDGTRRNESQWVDALLAGLHAIVELQEPCHGLVGVFHADERGRHFLFKHHVVVHDHNA